MQKRLIWIAVGALGMTLIFSWRNADAVIKAETPLKAIENDSTYILAGKVEQYYPDKPAMLVTVTEDIKGKAPFRKLPINCKITDEKIIKNNQIEPLLKRLGPDLDIIFFVNPRGKKLITFAFTNGTWFQVQGTLGEKNQAVFGLTSAEPYFRKSFKGTTEELRKLMKAHAAGKATLPPIDDKVEPGFGPEYAPKQKKDARAPGMKFHGQRRWFDMLFSQYRPPTLVGQGSLFAVIPTVGLGAPLAILALLFPAVFGGVFVLFRQWMAFITLISINSTLMILHWWLAPIWLRGTWWNTDAALWLIMTLATFGCTLWAWRRQLDFLYSGEHEAPQRTEHAVLLVMTGSCLLTSVLMWYFAEPSWAEVGWALTVVMTIGICAGTLYKFFPAIGSRSPFSSPSLATEGVILGAMLFGHLAFVRPIWGGSVGTDGTVDVNDKAGHTGTKIAAVVKKWDFTMKENGLYVSSPLVEGDVVYAAAAHPTFRLGTLVCLDRLTGAKKWDFIDDGDLKEMISSPCLADGKLYIGEGFHDDANCKLYCIDAATGKKHWEFKTAGQTESSPTAADGKVYTGAGNEGVYCLDAKNGDVDWKYPAADYRGRLLRFGAGMRVVGKRLYCGTGVDRNQKGEDKGETAVFCFDAATGKVVWKTSTPFPVWSKPVVTDGFVYITTGNGDIFEDEKKSPGGTLLCLDAENGQEKWRFQVDNGIIESPAIDEGRIYLGCRDGNVYCIGRADGQQRWRRFLDSPIIATPVVHIEPKHQGTISVFVAATGGKVCCLNPQTGDMVWTYNLTKELPFISASPRLVVTRTSEGYQRQLYFGAGLGGGLSNISAHRPVFYCLEDAVKVE